MSTSINVKFRPSGTDGKEGTIYYRIIHKRNARIIVTPYRVYESEWNEKAHSIEPFCGNSSSERIHRLSTYKNHIEWDVSRLRRIIVGLELEPIEYSTSDIITKYREITEHNSFEQYLLGIFRDLESMGRARTAETYLSTLHSFRHFMNGEDIPLDGIKSPLMQQYEAWLKQRGISLNTISFYMRRLRAAYNKAVEQELTPQKYPFSHVFTGSEKTDKRAITSDDIKRIKHLDLSSTPSLAFARDMFIFSFYTRGMSFIDMAYLRKKDLQSGYLVYHRHKTGQKLSIKWEVCMEEITEKYANPSSEYLLPIICENEQKNERKQYKQMQYHINYCLKRISRLAHMTRNLTMYVARHSWASIAYAKQIPISAISEGMGHDSEKTTRIYLASLDTSVVDKANKKILEGL